MKTMELVALETDVMCGGGGTHMALSSIGAMGGDGWTAARPRMDVETRQTAASRARLRFTASETVSAMLTRHRPVNLGSGTRRASAGPRPRRCRVRPRH